MRKHPVLLGFLILCLLIAVFFLLVLGVSAISGDRHSFSLKDKIGVVFVEGAIFESQQIIADIDTFRKDDNIRAVVLRIDSQGGGVAPSQEIYEAVVELKKKKKVVVSMGSLAASGGYLIACAANKIVANPGTLTGSISAVMQFADAEELFKKVGLRSSVIKSGKFKDIGSPFRKMTQEEEELLQEMIDDVYDQLLETIARDRKIAKEELRKIADGRVFTGRQARKLGLVDELGDMGYAVRLTGKLAGIKGEPDIVYPRGKKRSFWQLILKESISFLAEEMKGADGKSGTVQYIYSKN
ncbi:MAG: signal peptide peptidase SppA [Deltaproteobacteria bacterium]|nr:signal peptide peptidase SppA [Deltaproteobacteria bacterium]